MCGGGEGGEGGRTVKGSVCEGEEREGGEMGARGLMKREGEGACW